MKIYIIESKIESEIGHQRYIDKSSCFVINEYLGGIKISSVNYYLTVNLT